MDERRHYIFITKYRHTVRLGWDRDTSVAKTGVSRGAVMDAIETYDDSWEYGGDLYLDAHMINGPSFSLKEGDAVTLANCRWYSKCEVIVSCDIKAGEELTVKYQEYVSQRGLEINVVKLYNLLHKEHVLTFSVIN